MNNERVGEDAPEHQTTEKSRRLQTEAETGGAHAGEDVVRTRN